MTAIGAGLLVTTLIAAPALGACSNNAPANGETVTCDTSSPNPDPLGVDSAATNVTINIQSGAQIATSGLGISLNEANTTNSGAIFGDTVGVRYFLQGSVNNNAGGTIIGGAGIVSSLSLALDNAGMIRGTSTNAVAMTTGSVTNSSGGLIISSGGSGIQAGGAVIINNSGTISGMTGITTTGISGTSVNVTNLGTITGTSGTAISDGAGNLTLGLGTGSVLNGAVNAGGGTNTLMLSSGTGSEDSSFTGFQFLNASSAANWTLSGNLNPTSGGTQVVTFGTGSLDISGLISGGFLAKAGPGTLILSGNNTYTGGTFLNGGVLRASTDGNLGAASGGLNFSGGTLQFGAAFDLAATRAITFDGANGTFDTNGFNTTISQAIAGGGGLVKAGTGTLNLTGNSTYTGATTVNGGTLLANGSLASAVTVNSGGMLGGTGTLGGLTVGNSGTVSPGNSIGTLDVAGNVTFAPTSIYVVEINPQGQADRIVATGTATITGGTVQVQAESGFYRKDTRYTILTAGGGVVGTFSTLTTNLAFLDLSLVYDANNVFLNVNRNSVQFASLAHTENGLSVGRALDVFALNPPTADATTVSNALFNLSEPQARAAYDQISGAAHGNMVMSSLTMRRMFGRALDDRLMQEQGGVAARASAAQLGTAQHALAGTIGQDFSPLIAAAAETDEMRGTSTGWHTWVKGLGQFNSTAGNSNAAGYDLTIGGALLGADYKLLKGVHLGAAIGYAHGDFDGDDDSGSGGIDSYQGLIYGRYDHGKYFFADAQAGYAFNNYDMSRGIAFSTISRTASSDADGHDVSAQLRIGAKLDNGDFTIVPSASLRYDRLRREGFTETGANSLDLTVEGKSFTALRSSIGARASYPVKLDESGIELEPYAGVYWQHDFRDSAVPVEARFSGIGIDVHGTSPDRDAAVLQLGAAAVLDQQFTLFAGYDAELRTRQTDHAISAGLRYRW